VAQPTTGSQRWIAIAESAYPWERAALSYVRQRLPGREPFRAWSNFEFVAEDGSINEVDLLVVSQSKIYLVEIKSRPGRLSGDTGTWTWVHEGRVITEDNPLLLANRKAKKLKALLQHQHALRNSRAPYIEAVIFLSAPGLRCELSGAARTGVYLRHDTERESYPDIITVLLGTSETSGRSTTAPPPRIDRRLYHCALSPQTILITARERSRPQIKIFDWQTARREGSASDPARPSTADSLYLELFGDPQSLLYVAPEAIAGTAFDAPKLDLFGLGAVAYHIFSGCPPATSIQELHQKCAAGHGLRISEAMDGAGQELEDLIQFSTCPSVADRLDTVREFLDLLEQVEAELTAPDPEVFAHPLEARVGDTIEGGFAVKKRLGKGSTSLALLVDRDGREGVLKVALEPGLNQRVIEEGHLLRQLRHPNIVELYEQTQVSGHAALFMAVAGVDIKAGAYTLAQRLRYEGRLSLDLLQRFGEELLTVTNWLEQNGVLHSDYRQRFDNAEEMLHAWRRSFMLVDQPATEADHGPAVDLDQMITAATEDTPLSSLGLSPRLLDALARLGAHTVGELLRLPRIRLYRNQGLGQHTVKDIRNLAERLAQRFAARGEPPPAVPPDDPEVDDTRADPRLLSVDLMARLAVPQRIEADEQTILRAFLGLDPASRPGAWPAQHDVAERLGMSREAVQHALHRARQHWGRFPWMTALREDVARLIDKSGGVMTGHELATALLAARGSAADDPERSRLAAHYTTSAAARAQYAGRLGTRADALAAADPLLTPGRVVEELQAVPGPEGDLPLTPDRLLRLAVASSQGAALSSRMELYPQHMEAARALKLGIGSLLGPKALTVRQIQQRIASRYPLAAPLPGPPALDDLLRAAGIELLWDGTGADGKGVYRPKYGPPDTPSTSSTLPRLSTAPGIGDAASPEVEAAGAFEARLQQAVTAHRFLVLTVAPRHLVRAEAEIGQRFPVTRISLEALLIQEMKAIAAAAGAKWEVVLKADNAPRHSTDWRRLHMLVRQAMPAVEQTLLAVDRPVLLVYPGLLARYDQMQLLETLRDACARRHDVPGYLVLVASDAQRPLPVLDAKPIPVVHASEWTRIPDAWLANAHRA
jgi:hypothetical protein